MNSETKTCQNCKTEFIIESDDFGFYEKVKVPPPGICPECRFKWRALWRNERTLYSRTCDKCQRKIVSAYNPKAPYIVYCAECFKSDSWDAKSYTLDYDESQPFFSQLGDLLRKVPKVATYRTIAMGPNINSEYTNVAGGLKNCYLVFNTGACEDVMYSRGLKDCKGSSDLYYGTRLERCYELVNAQESNGVLWSKNVVGCVDSAFLSGSTGCTSCFGCVNLRHKSYHFLNEPMEKEEYKKRVDEIMGSYRKLEEFKKQFEEFSLKFPHRENNNWKTVDSLGDYLFECKNAVNCFEGVKLENCRYAFSSKEMKDSMGTTGYGYNAELLLECVAVGYSSRAVGCYGVENGRSVEYCFSIDSCENCIGCDGISHAKYSILNKEYTPERYKELRDKIVAEIEGKNLHGLIMPPEIAPFAYNECIAQENFPMTRDQALAAGFRWEDDIQMTRGKETIKPEQIPDHIRDVSDSITNEILVCVGCARNYKIIPAEFQFYRALNIPVPRLCFNCRHEARIKQRGPYRFYERTCAKCGKAIQTTYAPERPEVVYCEVCYQNEVV